MKGNNDETHATEGRKTVWSSLIIGILILLAGVFIKSPAMPPSLPKAEILTGACLIIGSVAALLIAS